MIQRVMAIAATRHSSATHHLPGRIGSAAGSSAAVPVIIGPISFLPSDQPVEEDRGDVQADEDQQHVEEIVVQVGDLFGRVEADEVGERALDQPVLVGC